MRILSAQASLFLWSNATAPPPPIRIHQITLPLMMLENACVPNSHHSWFVPNFLISRYERMGKMGYSFFNLPLPEHQWNLISSLMLSFLFICLWIACAFLYLFFLLPYSNWFIEMPQIIANYQFQFLMWKYFIQVCCLSFRFMNNWWFPGAAWGSLPSSKLWNPFPIFYFNPLIVSFFFFFNVPISTLRVCLLNWNYSWFLLGRMAHFCSASLGVIWVKVSFALVSGNGIHLLTNF